MVRICDLLTDYAVYAAISIYLETGTLIPPGKLGVAIPIAFSADRPSVTFTRLVPARPLFLVRMYFLLITVSPDYVIFPNSISGICFHWQMVD